MTSPIAPGSPHHIALTVSNMERSKEFYTEIVGMKFAAATEPRVFLISGSLVLALGTAPEQPIKDDKFDENRIGLDHISFSVASRDELEKAAKFLDEKGVAHGEIKDLAGFQIYVLAFRDPDNIQLELTAPYAK